MDLPQPQSRREKASIDLGLSVLRVLAEPGLPLTREDIAAWCDCTSKTIQNIEAQAMRKVRSRLRKSGVHAVGSSAPSLL